MRELRIYPRFRACVLWSCVLFGSIILVFAVVQTVKNLRHGAPVSLPSVETFTRMTFSVGSIAFVTGIILFAITRPWAMTLNESGVHGRDVLGRKRTIHWTDIAVVPEWSEKGLPTLMIRSTQSKRQIQTFSLGLDARGLYDQVVTRAGPDNALSEWLRRKTALQLRTTIFKLG